MFRIFIIITFLVGAAYAYKAVIRLFSNKIVRILYWVVIIASVSYFVFGIALDISNNFRKPEKMIGFANFFALYIFVALTSFILFLEDIFRIGKWIIRNSKKKNKHYNSRRKFVSQLALGIGALPFATLVYGVYQGRYNFKIHDYVLPFKDLPESFNGYKIVHVSDFHCGGLDNYKKVAYAVDLIKKQKADIILFTGDFIDGKSSEIQPWQELFASMNAKDGMYSILGNHDYCDYVDWPSDVEKEKDFQLLKTLQKEMGFKLLLNEHVLLKRNNEKICLLGVEYWGEDSLNKMGDIDKALKGTEDKDFKILMTHDPTHWEYKVIHHSQQIHLTLSGHTHGLQFGIEIPEKFKWTPFKHRFKYWAGMYKEFGQYLNVNRGFGYTGFPGRVGIWPEVSVIILKKA